MTRPAEEIARECCAYLHAGLGELEHCQSCLLIIRAILSERADADRRVAEAQAEIARHRCSNPSLDEALNSGDGSYRP